MPRLEPGIYGGAFFCIAWVGGTSPAMTVPIAAQRRPHRRARLDVPPPIDAIGRSAVTVALWLDLVLDISERRLVERSLALAHRPAEVDDPHVSRPARHIESVTHGERTSLLGRSFGLSGSASHARARRPSMSKAPPFGSPMKLTPRFQVAA